MTKQRAIYLKCLDCSGESAKEVTLCSILDCPLWEYRCGHYISSGSYQRRIEAAFSRYKEDVKELAQSLGLTKVDYLKKGTPAMPGATKKAIP